MLHRQSQHFALSFALGVAMSLELLAVWVAFTGIGAAVGHSRGQLWAGIIGGAMLGPLGILLVYVGSKPTRIPCLHCREKIDRLAAICPRCRTPLRT